MCINTFLLKTNLKGIKMATPEFNYQEPFPLGKDETEYYLLTKDHVTVSPSNFETVT